MDASYFRLLTVSNRVYFWNLDKEFGKVFGAVMPASLMLFGWLLGQNMDMFEAIKSGVSGIIVTIIFMILEMPTSYIFEKKYYIMKGIQQLLYLPLQV